jgi:hypothetical protein
MRRILYVVLGLPAAGRQYREPTPANIISFGNSALMDNEKQELVWGVRGMPVMIFLLVAYIIVY